MKFLYIKETNTTPKNEFKCIKLSKKQKKILHPNWTDRQINETNVLMPTDPTHTDSKTTFIYGLGYVKLTKTNQLTIPTFDGTIKYWDAYLKSFGKECLYFSLTGQPLQSMDCCTLSQRREFLSILHCRGGIVHYQKFVEYIEKIWEIQKNTIENKLPHFSEWQLKKLCEDVLIRPCFNIMCIIMPPYLDTPTDDDKMVKFFRTYRYDELRHAHPNYNRIKELESLMEVERNTEGFNQYTYTLKYWEYLTEYKPLKQQMQESIMEQLNKEINDENNPKLPISLRERIAYLFGEECMTLYSAILDEFKA